MRTRFLIPLALFLLLAVLLGFGLRLDPRTVPSPLIDKPVPDFRLARLDDPDTSFAPQEMASQAWLLNVWASWCVACRQEHAMLVEIAQRNLVPLVGLNYKEVRGAGIDVRKMDPAEEQALAIERANQWLTSHGDPYTLTLLDMDGRVGIDFGVYGVPETFLIDGKGRIRYKHLGPITQETLDDILLPKLREVQNES
ncbi:DsbE family thiol:disulfide interchange protein [Paracandidimonas soli]|uniref:Cytochrome c biogenesis protein CcmG/thiol:disulfide interchange protein DsbE n=1 Tax=Paracandidimonas soli TaxID=1917182 RepID=A0A4R3UM21_9BURK|nr:DsbE family thiol:disulfide interchange protein [Paracandidimonas soli]TCU91932.1 cytochrome c biogenesis protein CcmG/thiol:disulfide interchange protein DsbE [Paracandidimonas soli]